MGAMGRTPLAEAFKIPVFHGCKRVRMEFEQSPRPDRLLVVMSNDRKASMVRLRFQQSLDDLKDRLLVIAGMAKQVIQRAIRGLPNLVALGEQAIDHLEREVDQMALDLLATEHLLASDLRSTLAVIKLNGEPRTGRGTDARSQVQPAGDR